MQLTRYDIIKGLLRQPKTATTSIGYVCLRDKSTMSNSTHIGDTAAYNKEEIIPNNLQAIIFDCRMEDFLS